MKKLNKKMLKLEMWCSIPRAKLQGLNLELAVVTVKAKSASEARTTRATPGIRWSPAVACQL